MFLEGPTIGFDGFSMVFEILRAIVNDGLEVNNGCVFSKSVFILSVCLRNVKIM